jgi:hypothetical protein
MTGIKRQKLISEASSPKACLIAATLLAWYVLIHKLFSEL